jgi:uncharacterized protein
MPKLIGRPRKVRFIQKMPKVTQFSPRGKPGRPEIASITIDELEALKLTDYQGFSQANGATAMHISRSSFGRMVRESRRKLADAIINGKIIKIVFGEAQVGVRKTEFTRQGLQEEIEKFKHRTKAIIKNSREKNAGEHQRQVIALRREPQEDK